MLITDSKTINCQTLNSESSHVDDKADSPLISARIESLATNGTVLTNDRLRAIEERDTPITIREMMRILERSLCMDAAGSKSKFRKYFNIDKIKTSTDVHIQQALNRILQERNLGEDHLDAIAYLKDAGDKSAHDGRPVLCKLEWIRLLNEALTDEGDSQIVGDLVAALEHYIPCPGNENDPWAVTDPM